MLDARPPHLGHPSQQARQVVPGREAVANKQNPHPTNRTTPNRQRAQSAGAKFDALRGGLLARPVAELRIVPVLDDVTLLDWQRVHNEIIPTAPLSADEIRERAKRNVLEVA